MMWGHLLHPPSCTHFFPWTGWPQYYFTHNIFLSPPQVNTHHWFVYSMYVYMGSWWLQRLNRRIGLLGTTSLVDIILLKFLFAGSWLIWSCTVCRWVYDRASEMTATMICHPKRIETTPPMCWEFKCIKKTMGGLCAGASPYAKRQLTSRCQTCLSTWDRLSQALPALPHWPCRSPLAFCQDDMPQTLNALAKTASRPAPPRSLVAFAFGATWAVGPGPLATQLKGELPKNCGLRMMDLHCL